MLHIDRQQTPELDVLILREAADANGNGTLEGDGFAGVSLHLGKHDPVGDLPRPRCGPSPRLGASDPIA